MIASSQSALASYAGRHSCVLYCSDPPSAREDYSSPKHFSWETPDKQVSVACPPLQRTKKDRTSNHSNAK